MENSAEVKPEVADDTATENEAAAEKEADSENVYLDQLLAERQKLDPSLTACHQLLAQEIARVQANENKFIDLHTDTAVKVSVDVRVPVKEFPQFNFVGKILGPKGNSLKRIQEETQTHIAVLGRGSVKDKNKEDELRKEGGKFAHLNEELHVHVEAFAVPAEGYFRISQALNELRRHLVPQYNDEVTRSQLQELAYLNGKASTPTFRGRGGSYAGRGGGRGRGGPECDFRSLSVGVPAPAPCVSDASWSPTGVGPMAFAGTSPYGREGVWQPGPPGHYRPTSATRPAFRSYNNVPQRLR